MHFSQARFYLSCKCKYIYIRETYCKINVDPSNIDLPATHGRHSVINEENLV